MSNWAVDHITTWGEATLAIIGVLVALWAGMKRLYRMAKNIESLVRTTEENSRRLQHIEKQVKANGDISWKESLKRLEASTASIDERVTNLEHLPCHLHAEADRIAKAE